MFRFFLFAALLLLCQVGSAAWAASTVMVVTWRGCEEACQGFQDYLRDREVEAEVLLRDAERDKERLPGFLAEARDRQVDLIVTWGTSVSREIAGTFAQLEDPAFNHEIPQVFMIVADPVGAGIVESLERTGRPNVTGTYNRVPEEVNIETIRAYLPSFRRLGLLYNANEANSVLKYEEMAALAEAMGFELVARSLPLGDDGKPRVEDIAAALADLKAAEVDFLYLGSSSFLRANSDRLGAAAVEAGIPVLSPYEQLVRDGQALISVAPRYYDVGRLAGRQAERILVEGVAPGDLPVLPMTDFAVTVNMAVANALQSFPPIELLLVAETVE